MSSVEYSAVSYTEVIRSKVRHLVKPAGLVALLSLVACGNGGLPVNVVDAPATSRVATTSTTEFDGILRWQFDDMGTGQPVLFAYPNPERPHQPGSFTPSFHPGDTEIATCKFESNSSGLTGLPNEDGELVNEWVMLGGSHTGYYALKDFGFVTPIGAELPSCESLGYMVD